MPIYVYVCTHCPRQFEKIVRKMDEADFAQCPVCGFEAERGVETVSPFIWGRGGPFVG